MKGEAFYTIFQQGSTFVNINHRQKLSKGNNVIKLSIPSKVISNSLFVVPKGDSLVTSTHIDIAKDSDDRYNQFRKYEGKEVSFVYKGKRFSGELIELHTNSLVVKLKGELRFFDPKDVKLTLPRASNKSSSAVIKVYSDKSVTEEFNISYVVNQLLSWEPVYHMRLEDGKALLTHYALIKNDSDSEIKNGRFLCVAGDIEYSSGYHARALYSFCFDATEKPPRNAPEPQFKQVTELQRYSTPEDYDLKPGQRVKIPIGKLSISFESKYFIEGSEVMMKNEFLNDSNTLLNAGTVILYASNESGQLQFIGQKKISAVPRHETFTMDVGVPANVTAVKSVKGLTNGKKTYVITIKNLTDKKIKVDVSDRVTKDLKEVNPRDCKYEDNHLIWSDYEVKSKSKKQFYYVTKY